ncbi:DUF445 family protein [Metallumcola ferriviriculae]|uniref:DUF445 family protein n=1 Tax=Metallumcola ferriviriculae TaxID=3039180 RepID=A0AAU0UTP5_9FIRM|nr:DUF445 family protein [Desulfitibacteraceae bacterium MK1]
MWLQLIIIPLIGALIGWVTNVLAIKLIFRPFKPVKIPLTPWSIQGLIPKRQNEIAVNIGKVVENELISMEEILQEVNNESRRDQVVDWIAVAVQQRVQRRLPGILPQSVKGIINGMLDDVIRKEAAHVLEGLTGNISAELMNEIKVEHLVEEKLKQFDLKQLENLVLGIASTELKHIEVLGAILGFFIGLAQVGIFQFIK